MGTFIRALRPPLTLSTPMLSKLGCLWLSCKVTPELPDVFDEVVKGIRHSPPEFKDGKALRAL